MANRKQEPIVPRTEKQISKAVKDLLNGLGVEWYSTESGYLTVPDGRGGWAPRPGGTRTTPGIPDLLCYSERGAWPFSFTVELKGAETEIKVEQWLYALRRMRRGEPHFIVRSTSALLTGMLFLGVAPKRVVEGNYGVGGEWPDNLNYLTETRGQLVSARPEIVDQRQWAIVESRFPASNRKRRPPYPEG